MAIDTSNNSASSIVQSLQAGSGIDIRALAKGLAEAENQARIDRVTERKASVEASISGYGILASSVESLKYVIDGFKDTKNLTSSSVSSSSSELQATVTGSALAEADHELRVLQVARAQVTEMSVSSDDDVTNLASLMIAGTDFTPEAGATAAEVVEAINASDLGITATLLNRMTLADADADGVDELVDDWVIVLQGQTGSDSAFEVEVNSSEVSVTQEAADARLSFDGVTVYRADNTITDLVDGITLDLRSAVAGSTYQVAIRTDYSPLKTSLQDLVSVYNDINLILDELVAVDSSTTEYSGSLARDKTLVSGVRRQIKAMFDEVSATATGDVYTLRELGFSFDLDGVLSFDEATLDALLSEDPADVVAMLTGGLDGQSRYAAASARGLGLELSLTLEALVSSGGMIQPRVTTATNWVADYDEQLAALELRLQATYERYVQQFAAMESFVQRSKDIGNYLEGQFKAMQNSNGD